MRTNSNINAIIISLDKHKKRRQIIRERMDRTELRYDFFRALTPYNIPDHIRRFFFKNNGKPFAEYLLPGEIGCYASHLTIMHDILTGKLPSPILVLEDDAIPNLNYTKYIDSIFRVVEYRDNEIDYVNLHRSAPYAPIAKIDIKDSISLIKNYIPSFGTFSYIINKNGAEKFLLYRERRMSPIDLDIIIASLTKDFHVWESNRNIFCHDFKIYERAIDPKNTRRISRHPKFKLSYRRNLAKKKYGLYHDIRYSIARKIWRFKKDFL